MKLIATLLLLSTLAYAADEVKLSPAAQDALNKAEATVTANRKAYDSANAKAFEATEKALKAELDRLTKAGKLEEAMAVKKVLDGFRGDVVAKVDAKAKEKGDSDLLGGGGTSPNILIGKKMILHGSIIFTFNKDMTFTRNSAGNADDLKGEYSFDGTTLVITPISKSILTFKYDEKTKTMKSQTAKVGDMTFVN